MSDDANLSPDMRALVTVLREIRDEQRRVAAALEALALRQPQATGPAQWVGDKG
mgnify:CR=1 FL=1|jgi:hypothetical protein